MSSDPTADLELYLSLSPEGRDFVDMVLELEPDELAAFVELVDSLRRLYGGRLPRDYLAALTRIMRGAGLT
jgi:hypothetical protein